MIFDFSAILLIAAASGLVILLLNTILRERRTVATSTADTGAHQESILVSNTRAFLPVIVVVLLFRSFVFEPFRIPSGSMMPGLVDGDFIFVSKFSYGLRLPLFNTEVVTTGEPSRGDVIVFRSPADPSVNLIKRLIGLPGDHIVVRGNRVFINGKLAPLRVDGLYPGGYRFGDAALGIEQIGAAEHSVMFAAARAPTDFEGVVPAGHYFFMGDNRNDSQDSRFAKVGFVPQANLIGHALRIWMNWRIRDWPQWNRIGQQIR